MIIDIKIPLLSFHRCMIVDVSYWGYQPSIYMHEILVYVWNEHDNWTILVYFLSRIVTDFHHLSYFSKIWLYPVHEILMEILSTMEI